MIPIVVLDDSNGMLFNHRRQSQDKVLRARILELAEGKRLWMNAYSAKQFGPEAFIHVSEDFLEQAGTGDLCFVENLPLRPYLNQIEQLILFRWNRRYPGDFFFDLDCNDGHWAKVSAGEFPGSSHKRITEEVYAHD